MIRVTRFLNFTQQLQEATYKIKTRQDGFDMHKLIELFVTNEWTDRHTDSSVVNLAIKSKYPK